MAWRCQASNIIWSALWGSKGKMIVVTEGEIDALSVSKLWNNKFPVVSVKTGAAGAKKDLSKELEWLESFDSVVLCFDQDDAGKKAAVECARLFSPNKAKICSLPLKDANEMLAQVSTKNLLIAFGQLNHTDQTVLYVELIFGTQSKRR